MGLRREIRAARVAQLRSDARILHRGSHYFLLAWIVERYTIPELGVCSSGYSGRTAMLSHEDNELLCRVGPGTLMGDLFREYWLPAMQSEELPEPDCDQVRVLLLGEELVGFRDSNGNVGLVENSCPHRGASLYYARNEDCGLRCIYHGWKFDVNGNCVDMPNEPAQSNFKDRIKAVAYPTVERGGIIWTYMGPRTTPPPLPDLEGNMDESSMTYSQIRNCNWMQALEGDIDTVHFSWLHVGHIQPEDAVGDFMRYQVTDRSPTYSVLDTDWGTSYATFSSANEEENHCRMASFLMPCYTMVPQGVVMANRTVRAWVPMDDNHVIWFIMAAPPSSPMMSTSFVRVSTSRAASCESGRRLRQRRPIGSAASVPFRTPVTITW